MTKSVTTSKPVKAGEELFTYYGYGYGDGHSHAFPWYWDLKRNVEKKERLEVKLARLNKKSKVS